MKTYKILGIVLSLALLFAVGGVVSANIYWPNQNQSLSVTSQNVNVLLGQTSSITIGNYGTFYVSANTNQNSVEASVSGNTVSFYGKSLGNSNITICQNNSSNCATIYVSVLNNYINNNYNNNQNIYISNMSLVVGSSLTFTSNDSNTIYLSSNSNSSVVNVLNNYNNLGCNQYDQFSPITGQPCYLNYQNVYNNTLTISAVGAGNSTLVICQNGGGCSTYNINVIKSGNVLGITTTNNNCLISRTLRYGSYGSDVLCLQNYLISKGYYINNPNSYFDFDTRNAVILFQRDNGLFADGIVGRNTRSFLY